MKTILILALTILIAHCEDWEIQGKTYHNVIVQNVFPDRVEITYNGGVGSPALKDLPPELQKRFNYNPTAAQAEAQRMEVNRQAAIAQALTNAPAQAKQTSITPQVSTTPPVAAINPAIEIQRQQRIAFLIDDIATKQREVDKNAGREARGQINSQNSFREIISLEKTELAQLQK